MRIFSGEGMEHEWKNKAHAIVFIDGCKAKASAPGKVIDSFRADVFFQVQRAKTTASGKFEIQGFSFGR